MKRYRGESVDVLFEPARCLHAAECLRGLPAVFDTARRPWALPDAATPEQVADVVRRCPTGALHYSLADGPPEQGDQPTSVRTEPHAPMWVRGQLKLELSDGQQMEDTRAALCRCGQTANAPFCDASGDCTGWHERPDATQPVRAASAPPEQRS